MFPNTLDTFVTSVRHGKEMMIIHRVTGGYLTHNGDLQIETDPVENIDNRRHLWVVQLDGYFKGNAVYTFQNKREDKYLSVNPDNIRDGMRFTDRIDPKDPDAAKKANAQRFLVLPVCSNGGYALVPVLGTGHALMPMGNRAEPGCDRPLPHWGGQSSDNASHDFTRAPDQPERQDPTDRDITGSVGAAGAGAGSH
ncbi:hypothetical protein ACGF5F_04700 [Streptomyces sp. NPDC047821]|uniref:hypothetical protein n=1 Tax=unclassified Streptomyces TaxID=2593676 RepID=UPI00363F06E8